MAEYIEREAVRMAMDYIKDNYGADFTELNDIVSKLPAANVRENVTGEWIEDEYPIKLPGAVCPTHKCSVCGGWHSNGTDNYCPNCGAQMMGGAEDD